MNNNRIQPDYASFPLDADKYSEVCQVVNMNMYPRDVENLDSESDNVIYSTDVLIDNIKDAVCGIIDTSSASGEVYLKKVVKK